jgi:hypothetical protein
MNDYAPPKGMNDLMECLAWLVIVIGGIVYLYKSLKSSPAHPPNESLAISDDELTRRVENIETENAQTQRDLTALQGAMNEKISEEVTVVHNRVNEVLAAVSTIKGVVEQLSVRIGQLSGDIARIPRK